MEEELDSLRQRSARSTDLFEEMEVEAPAGGIRGFLGGLTPGQRLTLALLLFLDVIAVLFGLLLITGAITL